MKARLQILQHTLGLDEYGRGTMYRNRFVAGPGHHDMPVIELLMAEGLVAEGRVSQGLIGEGSRLYYVTECGKAFVLGNSPKPPKLPKVSRSQARYKRYVEQAECWNSFIDFCRWDARQQRSTNHGRAFA